jgi:two-component system, OmpR family, response regulator
VRVLLLEDDAVLAEILSDFLEESYEVTHSYSAKWAVTLCGEEHFDLYIFDINLIEGDGLHLLRSLRECGDATPAIVITAFSDISYLSKAFKIGANDFIRKPFELEELSLRIENIKRYSGLQPFVKIDGDLRLDTQKHLLYKGDATVALSKKQSELLRYLWGNKSRVVSTQEILQNLWEYEEMPSEESVRTLIKELRREIGKERIINIRGEGYKFEHA